MGCWNENIYGGDVSLDWRHKIYEICEVDEYDENDKITLMPADTLESKYDDITKEIDSTEDEDEKNIGYIVLGAIIMRSGADMSHLREDISKSALNDEWSKDNQIRKIVMSNYSKTVQEYNPEEPVDVENINLSKETEDTFEDDLAGEFKQLFGLMNARIKKLRKGIEEKSGVKEYDEGFADASQEEIDFLIDYKELISKQEQFAELLKKIESGDNFFPTSSGGSKVKSTSSMGSGKDISPG